MHNRHAACPCQIARHPHNTLSATTLLFLLLWLATPVTVAQNPAQPPHNLPDPRQAALSSDVWRSERRIIDLHQHIETTPERFRRAIGILDRSGVGLGVILGAGTVIQKDGQPSDFQKSKELADRLFPGRFLHSMILDYAGWDEPGWSERAAEQVTIGHRLGAAGLKEYKRLGLYLRDKNRKLIRIDDPRLDAVWKRCGELQMPVSIHVGDPKAFWQPWDENNERWTELRDHKSWWFGDAATYPPRMELLEALNRVIERHPQTTFVCVHFANNPEELEWVDAALDRYPNMYADMAARIPELGRHDPARVKALFEKHQDRILFATDFMVYGKLILGSGGDSDNPTDDDAVEFFTKCWRWMETDDRDWAHMTPIQGNWLISSINLPPAVARRIYFDNAQRLFARSIPLPVAQARFIERDFKPDGLLQEPEWQTATPARLEYASIDNRARPDYSTPVRMLWSSNSLYLSYECPFEQLTTFEPPQANERIGLWDRDVVELFIAPDNNRPNCYAEFEWAPNGETLDLLVDLPDKDFAWTAHAESAVSIDHARKIWQVEVRIPFKSLSAAGPQPGDRWRMNLYRMDRHGRAFLAFSPILAGSFHTPERFGWVEFRK